MTKMILSPPSTIHAQLFAVDGTNILLFAVELIIKHQRDFTNVAEYPRVCVEKYTS